MKNIILYIFLIHITNIYSQITGRVLHDLDSPIRGKGVVKIKYGSKVSSNNKNGEFVMSIDKTHKSDSLSFSFQYHPVKVIITGINIEKDKQIEIISPRLKQYLGDLNIENKNEFEFIHCLCYANQKYPHYKSQLQKETIHIYINNKVKKLKYRYVSHLKSFVINLN